MSFTDEQLRAFAYNDEAPTSTQMLARELIELRARPRDAYHTMDELYEQRMLWNALAVFVIDEEHPGLVSKSWRHHDGTPPFGKTEPGDRWFILTVCLPDSGQVTQHYPEKDWDLFCCPEVDTAPRWDGHTPEQVNLRIRRFLLRS